MNQERINLLPDPQFAALKPQLDHRLERAAKAITPASFLSIYDAAMRRIFTDALTKSGASEGSVWLLDDAKENLVNVFNNGPDAAKLMGFLQPLKAGIVSLVCWSEQSFLENDVFKNSNHDKTVDKLVGKRTNSMIVEPLYYAKRCRGVVSAVQLVPATEALAGSPGFSEKNAECIKFAAELLGRLIDFKLLSLTTGWGKD
ncbi:MAG: hypothetical protein WCH99_07500 [Verrucomicrobiota bacterium]